MLFHDTASRGGTQNTGNGSNKRTGSAGKAVNFKREVCMWCLLLYPSQIHSYCQQFVAGLQHRPVDPKPAAPTKSSYSTLLVCGGIPKRELLGDLAKG